MENSRVLVIGDFHAPYNHIDAVAFLTEINRIYRPDRVISIGDEQDKAIIELTPLYNMFPVVDILESNHGSLTYRKAKTHGIPRRNFKSYREMLEAPETWRWHESLTITLSNGKPCYFVHGKTVNPILLSQTEGMNAVQGHYHEKFGVTYWASNSGIIWQAFTGCLVNDSSLAMAYNKLNIKRPILGSLLIFNGNPIPIPMVLDQHKRWIGKIL